MKTPEQHFLASGYAEGGNLRNALDGALFSAGLGEVAMLQTGPVVPPGCRLAEFRILPAGSLVMGASACFASAQPGEVIAAGVAVAYPCDPERPAIVMEHGAAGHKEDIEYVVRHMAADALHLRGQEVRDMVSLAVQHRVVHIGAVLAALVLWA